MEKNWFSLAKQTVSTSQNEGFVSKAQPENQFSLEVIFRKLNFH